MQARRAAEKAMAPNLAAVNAAIPTNLAAPTVAQPHLAVPINESRPKQAQVQVAQANAPTLSETGEATATNLGDAYRAGGPKAPDAPAASAESSNASGKRTKDEAVQTAGDGKGVVVVSVDPADVAALAKLPSDQREALILVGASGFSYEEAAGICGCAVGTIKSRVNRARTRLAELMSIESLDDFGPDRATRAVLSGTDH